MDKSALTCRASRTTVLTRFSCSLLFLATPVLANDAPFDPDSPWLLGNWVGYRKHLADEGVDFQVDYTTQSAANLAADISFSLAGGGVCFNATPARLNLFNLIQMLINRQPQLMADAYVIIGPA